MNGLCGFKTERLRFFLKNLLRGWLWLFLIVAFFIFLEILDFDYYSLLNPFYDRPVLLYLIYSFSETFFGIIPPELFMIWARGFGDPLKYMQIVLLLAAISYMAGIIGYFLGRIFGNTGFFHLLEEKNLRKVIPLVLKYGFSLVIIAALTPVPFSGTCMVVGSVKYPFSRFLLFASFRFLRYALYSWIIWKAVFLT